MLKSKKILALALAAIMVLSLAACASGTTSSSSTPAASGSSSGAPKAPVKLEYWFEGAGAERTPTYEKIINDFNAQSDYITVEGVYVDLQQYGDKANVAWAAGAFPDVAYTQDSSAASLIAQGAYLVIDDRFNAWSDKDQFTPASIKSVTSKSMKGEMTYVPTATNVTGIWYRKDLFTQQKVDAPTTWDKFFEACEKMTFTDDKGNKYYGHTLRGGAGSSSQLVNEIICYVGLDNFWSADGKAQILRDPKAAEFVKRFTDIYKKGQAPESSLTADFKAMVADFNANVAATLIHNLGSYENQRQTFTPDQYAFLPFPPAVNGKQMEMLGSAKGVAIGSDTKYPDEAWEFTKWHCSHENISALNEAVGELPTRVDAANDQWVKDAPHMSNLPEYSAKEKIVVESPTYLPDWSNGNKTVIEPIFQEVLSGKVTPESFLDTWATQLEGQYAEYLKAKAATK